jgi:hypothetical protein
MLDSMNDGYVFVHPDFPGVEIAFVDDDDRIVVSGGSVDHLEFVCAWLQAQGFPAARIDAEFTGARLLASPLTPDFA